MRVKTRVVLLGVPYDADSSFMRGAAGAPPLIRDALRSEQTNGWAESLVDVRGAIEDGGDIVFNAGRNVRTSIDAAATALIGPGVRPIFLGGDHSITYPLVRAMRRHYPRLALLHLDAHPDLYDQLDGNRYSHACPFARIMEHGLVDRLVQVGIRTLNGHQRRQANRYGVETITMQQWGLGRRLVFSEPLYISVDIDALDPAFAPGVSHREPGGFSVREILTILQQVRATIIGADVVEFNPVADRVGLTAWVAAKIVREIAARALTGQNGRVRRRRGR